MPVHTLALNRTWWKSSSHDHNHHVDEGFEMAIQRLTPPGPHSCCRVGHTNEPWACVVSVRYADRNLSLCVVAKIMFLCVSVALQSYWLLNWRMLSISYSFLVSGHFQCTPESDAHLIILSIIVLLYILTKSSCVGTYAMIESANILRKRTQVICFNT